MVGLFGLSVRPSQVGKERTPLHHVSHDGFGLDAVFDVPHPRSGPSLRGAAPGPVDAVFRHRAGHRGRVGGPIEGIVPLVDVDHGSLSTVIWPPVQRSWATAASIASSAVAPLWKAP